ncbi:MAG TPA: uroporphyrinogen-III synthase [Thermoanaerobaculia bacterium]|nr:uroporphyrinogen-III synthase [Thermoanaerobaculia bacterium]
MAAGHVTVGSRRTPLALAQTELVARRLARAGFSVQVLTLATGGDRSLGGSLATAKGLFTAELDRALLAGNVDLAVHSLKDLPLEQDPRLELAAVPAREHANDLLVLRREDSRTLGAHPLTAFADDAVLAVEAAEAFAALPLGATIGTSSPRRQSGALALRPDLVCVGVRGSVERRLERLRSGAVDALLLAEAGVVRLLREHALSVDSGGGNAYAPGIGLSAFRLELASWPAAPGQGALAVQVLANRPWSGSTSIEALDHRPSRRSAELERELLEAVGGGCALPFGASADGSSIHAALAAESWRAFAGVGAAPTVVRRSFPLDGFDPGIAANELRAAIARVGTSTVPSVPALRLDAAETPPRLVVTSTPAAAARLTSGLVRQGVALPGSSIGSTGVPSAVAALEVTVRRALPGPWPVDQILLGESRQRWPWVLVSSPGAAAVLVERAATEPVWLRLAWCALGEGTARALLELGVPAGLCAGSRDASGFADFALRHLDPESPLFLPQSALASPALAARLRTRGRSVVAWPAYTVEPRTELSWPAGWDPPAAVLFTAPSAVAAWVANELPWPTESWAMGDATQRELERLGAPAIRRTEAPAPAHDASAETADADRTLTERCAP